MHTDNRLYVVQFNISHDGSMDPSVSGTLITPHKPTVSESSHFTLVRDVETALPRSYRVLQKRYLGWHQIAACDKIEKTVSFINFSKAPWLDK